MNNKKSNIQIGCMGHVDKPNIKEQFIEYITNKNKNETLIKEEDSPFITKLLEQVKNTTAGFIIEVNSNQMDK